MIEKSADLQDSLGIIFTQDSLGIVVFTQPSSFRTTNMSVRVMLYFLQFRDLSGPISIQQTQWLQTRKAPNLPLNFKK